MTDYNFKKKKNLFMKIDFVKAAFLLGLHCLPKYPFRGFWYIGLNKCLVEHSDQKGSIENIRPKIY